MENKRTITVDLEAIRAEAFKIAADNEGLETASGNTPEDLDYVLEVFVKCDATRDLMRLIRAVVEIHHDAQGFRGKTRPGVCSHVCGCQ